MNITKNIVISLFVCGLLHFLTYQPYGFFPHIMAIFSFFVISYNALQIINSKSMQSLYLFPFIFMNWLYFQSPFLLKNKTEYFMRIIDEKYISEISVYTCLSIFMIYIGYNLLNNSVTALTPKSFSFNLKQLRKIIFIFVIVGLLYRIFEQFSPALIAQLSNIIQVLFYAPTIVVALYVVYLLRKKEEPGNFIFHFIVLIFILMELLVRLSTTLFANVVILFIGGLIAFYRERRKIPIFSLVIASLILYPIYEARKYLRLEYQDSSASKGQLELGKSVLEEAVLNEDIDSEIEGFENKSFNKKHNRFENLSFISHVVLQHKLGDKEFLYGETFYWLPLVPIPRVIYPSKPVNEMSTTIATAYGVRGVVSNASINFPMLVEGYINFGFNGMLILALLFGLTYKWFALKFGFGIGDINLMIMVNAFKQFTHAEGNITLVFGALIQVYLFWWVLVRLLNWNKIEN